MAKSNNNKYVLPGTVEVTVIAQLGKRIRRKDMPLSEAQYLKKHNKGWQITLYQKGTCTIEPTEDNDK